MSSSSSNNHPTSSNSSSPPGENATASSSSHPTAATDSTTVAPTLSSPLLTRLLDMYTTLNLAYEQRSGEAEYGSRSDHIHKLTKLDQPGSTATDAEREWAHKEARTTAGAATDAWNEVNKPEPTHLILFHCGSQLERTLRFRYSLTTGENPVCCLKCIVLTIRI